MPAAVQKVRSNGGPRESRVVHPQRACLDLNAYPGQQRGLRIEPDIAGPALEATGAAPKRRADPQADHRFGRNHVPNPFLGPTGIREQDRADEEARDQTATHLTVAAE